MFGKEELSLIQLAWEAAFQPPRGCYENTVVQVFHKASTNERKGGRGTVICSIFLCMKGTVLYMVSVLWWDLESHASLGHTDVWESLPPVLHLVPVATSQ